jgi:hypothetical protein
MRERHTDVENESEDRRTYRMREETNKKCNNIEKIMEIVDG